MRGRTDRQIVRIGVLALIGALLAMTAALNLQKFPGFRGVAYAAEFSDASGLREGSMVQVAGIDVGRVSDIELAGDRVVVHFTVDSGTELGEETRASVEVLNLLGEKFLHLRPEGSGELAQDAAIPLDRTDASYDIVQVFDQLADTTEEIDLPQLQQALDEVSTTMNRSSEEAAAAFTGLSRLSRTVASRDAELQSLLKRARSISGLLAERKGDVVALVEEGDLILRELKKRREAIHTLLVNTSRLSRELGGLVDDNQAQIGPMLRELREVTQTLVQREKQLRAVFRNFGPYVRIMSNVIGTGPWFDAYASNLFALGSGEFTPGVEE